MKFRLLIAAALLAALACSNGCWQAAAARAAANRAEGKPGPIQRIGDRLDGDSDSSN